MVGKVIFLFVMRSVVILMRRVLNDKLKKLWNWIISKTSTAPTLTVVQEAPAETPSQILVRLLLARGVNAREISITKVEEKFDAWYDGPITDDEVSEVIPDFKKAYGISFSDD